MIEAMKKLFAEARRHERHRNVEETQYWCDQYRLLAAKFIAEAEKQEPVAWWIPKAEQFCLQDPSGERPFAKAWEPLYTHPQPRKPVKFPTMLRKMWSGGEVQAWLDEHVNKE